jgi:hypothetical protein
MKKQIPWDLIFEEYLNGYTENDQLHEYTYQEIADKFNVKRSTLDAHAQSEGWTAKREAKRLKDNNMECVNNLVLPEDIKPESIDAIVYDRLKLLAQWGKKARSLNLKDEKTLSEILTNYKKILGNIDTGEELKQLHNEKHLKGTLKIMFQEKFQKPIEGTVEEIDPI